MVGTRLVLAHANLITELAFELEMRVFLDVLKLHALEHTIIFFIELGLKKLSYRLKSLGLGFLTCCNKFATVVFMKQHVKPLKC